MGLDRLSSTYSTSETNLLWSARCLSEVRILGAYSLQLQLAVDRDRDKVYCADVDVEQASSSEPQQLETLQVQSVESESSSLEHGEQSWWSSDWMTEAIAEEAETSALVQLFCKMLEREHQCAAVQGLIR